jgi:hypothetical protein
VFILVGLYSCVLPTDEARSNEKGVLVHRLAGVSRSVTITVAYLMYKLSLNLNDAFNMVRARKSNIAPNFHFMQQLHNFECELARSPKDAPNSTQGIVSLLVMFLCRPNFHIHLITVVVPVQCFAICTVMYVSDMLP